MKSIFLSENSQITEMLGEKIGVKLKGGEVIELVSDLGGGKTTFVRGLARGAGSVDQVSSPTFTINQVYETPKFAINHFDFYRLSEAGILSDELSELIDDKNAVIVVEWGEVVSGALPEGRLIIKFKMVGENERELTIEYPNSLNYLLA